MVLFQQDADQDFVCSTWFERDRRHVRLETPRGRVVFELWDEAVDDAIESGYLNPPRHPRPGDDQWREAALEYARSMGLLKGPDERAAEPEHRARMRG
jgi:hypothetical protein